jgi:hypothetical protein
VRPHILIATVLLVLSVLVSPARANLEESSGKVALLRVHDVGTLYGPANDQIDVEVIVWLDTKPGMAFGFQLRDDANRAARQGMLELLRDAMNHGYTVTIDYNIDPNKKNGVIIRTWITKPPVSNFPVNHPVN